MTIVVGITGGMASGKSTATAMLKRPGIRCFNADDCAHRLLKNHPEVIRRLAERFPAALEQGMIDRSKLAACVVGDDRALHALEQILHPFIRAEEEAFIARAQRQRLRAVALDIPLLFETGADALCDLVIAVDASEKRQRRRAFSRPGMSEEKYRRLRARQLPARTRNQLADSVISSNLGKAQMRRELETILKRVMTRA